jgi:DNA polymerase-1
MLIDAHHMMHRSYYAFRNLSLLDGTPTGMIYGTINILLSLIKKYEPKDLIICYDGGSRRRKEIYLEYKSNRIVDRTNGFYQQMLILKQILDDIGTKQITKINEEADDIIGTLAKKLSKKDKIIIVSGDHDFLQLIDDNIMVLREGSDKKLYLKDMIEKEYEILPEQLIDVGSISGDMTDNIKGLEGYGPKKSIKLIKEYGSLENLIEKSQNNEDLKDIYNNIEKLVLNKKLITIIIDLPMNEIKKPESNLELVKFLFENYLKFSSFLKRWPEIEKLSKLGGEN